MTKRNIHPDFLFFLDFKEQKLITLYKDLRDFVLSLSPETNEFLYHTHALTSVYSPSAKLSDSFCMIPIYTNHLNLGFSKGTLLKDSNNLLQGTGKYIRHIPITSQSDYRNEKVQELVLEAIQFAVDDMDNPSHVKGETFSKIKR